MEAELKARVGAEQEQREKQIVIQAPDMEREVPSKPFDNKASYTAPFFTRYMRPNKWLKGLPKGGAPFWCVCRVFRPLERDICWSSPD